MRWLAAVGWRLGAGPARLAWCRRSAGPARPSATSADRLLLVALWLVAGLSGRLSLGLAAALCRLVGWLGYWLRPGLRAAVQANLAQLLPTASAAARWPLGGRLVGNVVWGYYELAWAAGQADAVLARRLRLIGGERLAAARAGGRGVILVAPHLGSFGLMPRLAASQGSALATDLALPLAVVTEWLAWPPLQRQLARWRGGTGVRLVPADRAAGRWLRRWLAAGGVVVLAADRPVAGPSRRARLGAGWAQLPIGPARLARLTGAVLLPVWSYRTAAGGWLIAVEPPVPLAEGASPAVIELATTERLAAVWLAAVRRAPTQWAVLTPLWEE